MTRGLWAVAIGLLGVALASVLFRLVNAPSVVFVVLLIWCVGLVAGLVALVVDISPGTGAAGGLVAALLVAAVLALTIAAAPLAPGATRPGLRDLLWTPLLVLLAVVGLCALSGWSGVRGGLFLARRRKA
jgi:hypothetical protein